MLYWIWLSQLKRYGPEAQRKLIKDYGSPKEVFNAFKDALGEEEINTKEAEKILSDCKKKNIWIQPYTGFGITDQSNLPILLYCRGTWKNGGRSLGIVGSRRCSEYGKRITCEVAGRLAEKGTTIVSGLAKGIDSYAHSAALLSKGYTIAVLGCGPDICYPSEHRSLMAEILKVGLVVSEYPPGTRPTAYSFPARNRIIAALSDSILVPEATLESGSLITVNHALKYGKPVFAVPGRLDSPESAGANALIASGSAKMWTNDYLKEEYTQLVLPGLEVSSKSKKSKKKSDSLISNSLPKSPDFNIPKEFSDRFMKTCEGESEALISLLEQNDRHMSLPELQTALNKTNTSLMGLITQLELMDLVYISEDNVWLQ